MTEDTKPTPSPAPEISPRVAKNLCQLLERVQVTGMEAVGWVEAYQILQKIALTGQAGVQFPGL